MSAQNLEVIAPPIASARPPRATRTKAALYCAAIAAAMLFPALSTFAPLDHALDGFECVKIIAGDTAVADAHSFFRCSTERKLD